MLSFPPLHPSPSPSACHCAFFAAFFVDSLHHHLRPPPLSITAVHISPTALSSLSSLSLSLSSSAHFPALFGFDFLLRHTASAVIEVPVPPLWGCVSSIAATVLSICIDFFANRKIFCVRFDSLRSLSASLLFSLRSGSVALLLCHFLSLSFSLSLFSPCCLPFAVLWCLSTFLMPLYTFFTLITPSHHQHFGSPLPSDSTPPHSHFIVFVSILIADWL